MVFCYICNLTLVGCMIVPQFWEALLLEELQMFHFCSFVNNMWYSLLNYMHVGSDNAAAVLSFSYRKRLNPALKKSSTTTSKSTVCPSKSLKCLSCYFNFFRGRGCWWLLVASAHLHCVLFSLPIRGCQGALIFERSKVKVPPESRTSANCNRL